MTAALLDGDPVVLAGIKKLVRGKTWDPIVVLKDANGTPLDLSGWTGVRLDLRVEATDRSAALSPTCTILDLPYSGAPTGRLRLKSRASDTANVAAGISKLKGDPEFYKDDPADPGNELVRTPFTFEVDVGVEYTKA